jgi:FkbM family methyltransferase
MHDDLIYDVGLHNGDDTAFYLRRGFRVVAVEADPSLVGLARRRFATELRAGRLTLVHAGIADQDGTAEFYLCEGKSEFNSFDRANATKFGHQCHAIEIPCRRFGSILRQHGLPHYLKIDIECFDSHCVAELQRDRLPKYISCELTKTVQIEQLAELGYDAFKLVWQGHHRAVLDDTCTFGAWLRTTFRPVRPVAWIAKKYQSLRNRSVRSAARALRKWRLLPPENPWNWKFPHGSSGPFGEDAPGEWIDRDEALFRWFALRRECGEQYWVDIHATCLTPSACQRNVAQGAETCAAA